MNPRIAKSFKRFSFLAVCAVLAFWCGCESEDSPEGGGIDEYFANNPYVTDPRVSTDSDVAISPVSAKITYVGQKVTFDGIGGEGPYEWDVSYRDRGTLTVIGWSECTYTATQVEPNQVIVHDQHGHAAIAEITVDETPALTLTSSASSLSTDFEKAVLTAAGGVPPYSWEVDDPATGLLSSSTGNSVIYTRVASGDNAITVTDAEGTYAIVVIQQP
jgi:hypothetical protein